MRMERASMLTSLVNMNSAQLDKNSTSEDEHAQGEAITLQRPWLRDNRTFYLQWLDRWISVVDETDQKSRNRRSKIENELEELKNQRVRMVYYVPSILILQSYPQMRDWAFVYRHNLRNLRLAMRVDRFRRRHSRLPASLDEVLDDNLKEVPLGLHSEKPPVYKQTDHGFTIYPRGKNGVDDGGVDTYDVTGRNDGDSDEYRAKITIRYRGESRP